MIPLGLGLRRSRRWAWSCCFGWVLLAGWTAEGADLTPLLRSAQEDPSYKVRLQALRILSRRLQVDPDQSQAMEAVRALLRQRAQTDEHHVVRALAVRLLADWGPPSDRSVLEEARRDSHPFVRTQATAALKRFDARLARPRPNLVLAARVPEGELSESWVEHRMWSALDQARPGAFTRSPAQASDLGYWLQVQVEGPMVEPGRPDQSLVRLKVVVATWPAKNLRHVITTRARARAPPDTPGLTERLVQAAIEAAARDVIAEIRKG